MISEKVKVTIPWSRSRENDSISGSVVSGMRDVSCSTFAVRLLPNASVPKLLVRLMKVVAAPLASMELCLTESRVALESCIEILGPLPDNTVPPVNITD